MARPRPLRDVLNIPAPPPPTSANHGRKRVSARKRPRPEIPTDVTAAPRRSRRVLQQTQSSHRSHPSARSATSLTTVFTEDNPASTARPTKRLKAQETQPSSPSSSHQLTEEPYQHADDPRCPAEDEVIRVVLEQPAPVSEDKRRGCASLTREVLVDWLMEVGVEYSARATTLALAVSYLDRVLAVLDVPRENLQLLAITCMLIACKVEETEPPSIADVEFICDHLYKAPQVLAMEETVINLLGFRLTQPTHLSIVGLLAARVGQEVEEVVDFAAHLAMMDPYTCKKGPGVVALGCVMAACWVAGVEEGEAEKAVGTVMWSKWKGRAMLVVDRLFHTWKCVKNRHDADESRFIFIRWADIHDRLGETDRKRNEARMEGMADVLVERQRKRRFPMFSSLPR